MSAFDVFSSLCSITTISFVFFFFKDTAPTEIYPLSLPDPLPISHPDPPSGCPTQPVPPSPSEAGWKDVFLAPPFSVTRIRIRIRVTENGGARKTSFHPASLGEGGTGCVGQPLGGSGCEIGRGSGRERG